MSQFCNGVCIDASSSLQLILKVLVLLTTYATSYFYIILTALIGHGIGYNTSFVSCASGIFICLSAYVWTKVLIYLFMVERVVRALPIPFDRSSSAYCEK